MKQPKSAYILQKTSTKIERHTFAVIVDNLSGVLARVVGMFSARGYNIESLTVSPVDANRETSRITIVTSGTPDVISQVKARLSSIVAVHSAIDITESDHIEKEIALIKVEAQDHDRREALRLAEVFKAEVVDATLTTFIFMIVGDEKWVRQFIELQRQIGTVEVARSGVVAMKCGQEIMDAL